MRFFREFKSFAMRGNVVDLAIAVVIGAAFGRVTTSLVDGIVMPFLGLFTGGIDVSDRVLNVGRVVIKWGIFLQSVIDFILIAFVLFCLLSIINKLHMAGEKKKAAESAEVKLLTEIRDALRVR